MKDSGFSVGPRTSRAHLFEFKALVMKTSARGVRGPTEELECALANDLGEKLLNFIRERAKFLGELVVERI